MSAPAADCAHDSAGGYLLWVGGVPAVVKEGKSARVGVAFVQQRDNLASFHVEIENLSTMPIEVGRLTFSGGCMRSQDGTKRTCGPSHWVTNPERCYST